MVSTAPASRQACYRRCQTDTFRRLRGARREADGAKSGEMASIPISICIVPRNESQSGANGGLVAVVVYDGLSLFEYGCAVGVFGLPRPEMGKAWYRFATCSAELVLTSAGSAAGIDLCLHLIRRDFGPRAANQVARRLVMPPHREGGQAQYIAEPVSKRSNASLAPPSGRGARNIGRRLADCQDGKASRNESPHVPAALCQYDGYAAWRVVADRAFKPSEGVARRHRFVRG